MVSLKAVEPSLIPPDTDPSELDNIIASYYYSCKEVTPYCPVEATTLGYRPNLGISIFFAVMFGLSAVTTLYFGIKKKTWGYMGFIAAGCALEMAGKYFLIFFFLYIINFLYLVPSSHTDIQVPRLRFPGPLALQPVEQACV